MRSSPRSARRRFAPALEKARLEGVSAEGLARVELTPEQQRKIALIKSTLAQSDERLTEDLKSIEAYEGSSLNSPFGLHGYHDDLARYTPEWPGRVRSVRDELLRARERLDGLKTGLHAQRRLSVMLGEMAAACDDWAAGLASNDPGEVFRRSESMRAHWTRAGTIGREAMTLLEQGR